MALEQITFNIGAFNDSDAGGNNYFTNTVFEVKNQSDNTFATIYSDASGTTQIPQNGIDNVSNSRGECNFYIDDGDFYLEVNSQQKNFNIGNFKTDFTNIDEVKAYSKLSKLIGQRITTGEYHAGTGYGGASYDVVTSSSVTPNDIDIIQGVADSGAAVVLIVDSYSTVDSFGAVRSTDTDASGQISRAFESGVFDFPVSKNYKIEKQIILPQTALINGNNSTLIVDDIFSLPEDFESWTLAENAGKEGVLRFKNGQRQYDENTASDLEINNLHIKHYRSNENSSPRTLKPTNTKRIKMRGCKWEMDGDGSVKGTNIWVDGANNNLDIRHNHFINTMKKVQDGGGCFWVSSIVGYTSDESQFTKGVDFSYNILEQDNDDDLIALFARQSVIENVTIKGNKLSSSGTTQTVLVSVHSVLDFLPQTRADTTSYSAGEYIGLASPNGYFYKCTQGGTSGSGEEPFIQPIDGTLITDGTCVFEAIPCGVRGVDFSDNYIKDGSSEDFTIRVGRDREPDLHAETRNVYLNKTKVKYVSTSTQDSIIRVHQPQAKNVQVSKGRLTNNSSTAVTFGVNGADDVSGVVLDGKFTQPVLSLSYAGNNTWILPEGVVSRPFASAPVSINNNTVDYMGVVGSGESFREVINLNDIYFSNNTKSVNLIGNSNNLSGAGWTGTGQFTEFTKNYSQDVYSRMRASRLVNYTGSAKSLVYAASNINDGLLTFYIAIKSNIAKSGYVSIKLQVDGEPTQVSEIRHYYGGEYSLFPVTLEKNSGSPSGVTVSVSMFDGTDLSMCDAQLSYGGISPYCYTEGDRVNIRGVVIYAPSPPTTGFWFRGDRVVNSEPSIGDPKSWVCTDGDGTDVGIWISEGIL